MAQASVNRRVRIVLDVEIKGESVEEIRTRLTGNLESSIGRGLLDIDEARVESYSTAVLSAGDAESREIMHWDHEHPDRENPENIFISEIDDQRTSHGQVYHSIRRRDGDPEQDLTLTMISEINAFQSGDTPLPCLHISMDSDNAVSMFRTPKGIVLRLEPDIRLERETLPDGSSGYLLPA